MGFDFSVVKSSSMNPSLVKKDIIVSMPFLWTSMQAKRNDIIIFRHPYKANTLNIKRLIGLPGELICCDKGQLYIDGTRLHDHINARQLISISLRPTEKDRYIYISKKMNLLVASQNDTMFLTCNQVELKEIQKKLGFDNFRVEIDTFPKSSIVSTNAKELWSLDDWGPMKIPHKGDSIDITIGNIQFYKSIIETIDENTLEITNNDILVNGQMVHTYTFKEDYFFFLGDNRYSSVDSRNWGFIPSKYLKSKMLFKF